MAMTSMKLRSILAVAQRVSRKTGRFVAIVATCPETTSLLSSGAFKPLDAKGPYHRRHWLHDMNQKRLRAGRSAAFEQARPALDASRPFPVR